MRKYKSEDNYIDLSEKEKEIKEELNKVAVKAKSVEPFTVWVKIPKLNIRVSPAVDAETIDSINQGQSVTIVAEQNGWGKLKYIDGWINLKYTERT